MKKVDKEKKFYERIIYEHDVLMIPISELAENYGTSPAHISNILNEDTQMGLSLQFLAVSAIDTQDYKSAIKLLKQILKVNPNDVNALSRLAQIEEKIDELNITSSPKR